MTNSTSLSLAAQAVLDAVFPIYDEEEHLYVITGKQHAGMIAATALRAAADQVVPQRPEPTEDSVGPTIDYGYAWALWSSASDIRQRLIAIATELESVND